LAIEGAESTSPHVVSSSFFHLFVEKGGAKTIDGPRRFPQRTANNASRRFHGVMSFRKSGRRRAKAPQAEASGVMMSGRSIQYVPHSGLGLSIPEMKRDITPNPMIYPVMAFSIMVLGFRR